MPLKINITGKFEYWATEIKSREEKFLNNFNEVKHLLTELSFSITLKSSSACKVKESDARV